MALSKCSLCEYLEDPRWGVWIGDTRYPLCDGCSPNPGNETPEFWERLKASGRGHPHQPTAEETLATLRAENERLRAKLAQLELAHETHRGVIADASDIEHQIVAHADTLPVLARKMAEAIKALDAPNWLTPEESDALESRAAVKGG